MGLRKDIWRTAILDCPMAGILKNGIPGDVRTVWLPPSRSFCFRADPFGMWRDGLLYVFVEDYDYRVRVGTIDVFVYDASLTLLEHKPALRCPWHLSYPYVFEADGETWMLPEACRSGRLTLYRSRRFPDQWEPVCDIVTGPEVPVDATPFFHDGLWWLFYTPAAKPPKPVGELHIAFAESLTGPWTLHPRNPVRFDSSATRPGGTPCVVDGKVVLPVQNCAHTYGGAIRLLQFDTLTPDEVHTTAGSNLKIPAACAPYTEGMHTLSAAGPVTLADFKYTDLSPSGLCMQVTREIRKFVRDRF